MLTVVTYSLCDTCTAIMPSDLLRRPTPSGPAGCIVPIATRTRLPFARLFGTAFTSTAMVKDPPVPGRPFAFVITVLTSSLVRHEPPQNESATGVKVPGALLSPSKSVKSPFNRNTENDSALAPVTHTRKKTAQQTEPMPEQDRSVATPHPHPPPPLSDVWQGLSYFFLFSF